MPASVQLVTMTIARGDAEQRSAGDVSMKTGITAEILLPAFSKRAISMHTRLRISR